MDISARRLRIDDAEFAVRIASDVTRRKVSVERERTFLSDNSNILVVGLCDDEPSGFVVAHILDRFKDTSRKVLIYEVDVLPEFQR